MRDSRVGWLLAWLAVVIGGALSFADQPAPAVPEEADWLDYLIPRPKEIRITGSRHIAARDVIVRGSPDAGPISRQALAELRELLAGTGPAAPEPAAPPRPSASTFSLILASSSTPC